MAQTMVAIQKTKDEQLSLKNPIANFLAFYEKNLAESLKNLGLLAGYTEPVAVGDYMITRPDFPDIDASSRVH